MLVLGAAQLVFLMGGAAGFLLTMTGGQKTAAYCFGAGAFGNVALNLLFIPLWGIIGAAWATFASNILTITLLTVFNWKHLRIPPHPYVALQMLKGRVERVGVRGFWSETE